MEHQFEAIPDFPDLFEWNSVDLHEFVHEGDLAFSESLGHDTSEGLVHLLEQTVFVQAFILHCTEQYVKKLPLFLQSDPFSEVGVGIDKSVFELACLHPDTLRVLIARNRQDIADQVFELPHEINSVMKQHGFFCSL